MAKRSFLTSFAEFDVNGTVGLFPALVPSAVLSDLAVTVPLFAVSAMSINESYHLPPLSSSVARQLVDTHDDAIMLSASLIGADRFFFKEALELAAEQSMRGSVLERSTNGAAGGLILVTSLTIRTDIYVKSLSFSVNSQRRDVIDVSMALEHLPRPGILAQILDLAGIGVGTLLDFTVE